MTFIYLPIHINSMRIPMKKTIIIFSGLFIGIFIILLLIPVFFKNSVINLIKEQTSSQIEADLNIGDLNLSIFKDFPNLHFALKDVMITNPQADTMADIALIEGSIKLKSLLSGNTIIAERIAARNGRIRFQKDTSGIANWRFLQHADTPQAEKTSQTAETAESHLPFIVNNILFNDLQFSYNDYATSTYIAINQIDFNLSNNLPSSKLINSHLSLQGISLRKQNTVWINQSNLDWKTSLACDLKENSVAIENSDLLLNNLCLKVSGNISTSDNRILTDIHINTPDTSFKNLLSLLPPHLQPQIENMEAQGQFNFQADIEGEYYENHLPAFNAHFNVCDAKIKYAAMPEAINDININARIHNPGGSPDSTQIQVNNMAFTIADNPFNCHINILNPNNPYLNGKISGIIDFADLKKALPLKDMTLAGSVKTDMTFKGAYKYIEEKQYEHFFANGTVHLKNLYIVNSSFPKGISIPQGRMTVTPSQLVLERLEGKIYSSDFILQGKLSNYLPYLFRKETLKGDFRLNCRYINLNEFIIAQAQNREETAEPDSVSSLNSTAIEGALEIPRNVDIQLSANAGTILFDRLLMKNVAGKVTLSQATAHLQNMQMDVLKGRMTVNGKYDTRNPRIPKIDFIMNIDNFDIYETYHAFTFVRKSLPIAVNCNGKISAKMNFSADLDSQMTPVMESINGKGSLESPGIIIKDNPAMNQLATVLKNNELSRLSISRIKINFELNNGNIIVQPFNTSFAGNPVSIYGKQSVKGDLDYTLSMTINRRFFGNDINNLLKSIPGSENIKELDLDAQITGTLEKPIVKPDLSKAIKTVTQEIQKAFKGNILEGLQNLFKKK